MGRRGDRFYGAEALGNPFEAAQRGSRPRHNVPSPRIANLPAGGEPVTHEHRARDADQGAGDDVARWWASSTSRVAAITSAQIAIAIRACAKPPTRQS